MCIESCPVCHMTSSRSDVIQVGCDVRLSGDWSPSLQISRTGSPTLRVALVLERSQDSVEHLNYSWSLAYHASVSVSSMSSTDVYTTELVFDEERRPSASTATNIPTTNCTWQSPGISSADCKLWLSLIHSTTFPSPISLSITIPSNALYYSIRYDVFVHGAMEQLSRLYSIRSVLISVIRDFNCMSLHSIGL